MDNFFRDVHNDITLPNPVQETRHLWDRRNLLIELKDADFKRILRLEKVNFVRLVDTLKECLEKDSMRGTPISPMEQVAITLAYLGHGSYQHVSGIIVGTSKNAAHVSIHRTLDAIITMCSDLIALPTQEDMRKSAQDIFLRFRLPNFALGVDGTFVRLGKKPTIGELTNPDNQQTIYPQDYWCRKQFYAINVMVAADSDMLIRELLVGWAGSTHDARVWRNSSTKPFLEGQLQYTIAADSAYPISRQLVKPFLSPESAKEVLFNKRLSALRTTMTENVIGVMKNRFPILRLGINTKVKTAEKITFCAGILHNLATLAKDPEIQEENEDNGNGPDNEDDQNHGRIDQDQDLGSREAGKLYRNMLVQRFC